MKKNISNNTLVYSTDQGRIKSEKKTGEKPKSDGIVRIQRETKGRKGKGVTLITGLPLNNDELKVLAKKLKQLSGSGGSIKEGVIEIQGDHRTMIKEYLDSLSSLNCTMKIAGG